MLLHSCGFEYIVRKRDEILRILITFFCIFVLHALYAASAAAESLLVLNKEDASLAIVDVQHKSVVAKIPTGEGPHEVVVSDDGKLAFASNYGSRTPGSTISVIDLAARKELRRVNVDPLRRPHGLAFAQGKLYFTAEINRVVARYDPAADRIDWIQGTGENSTHMVMVAPDLSRMFTANIGSDSIAILERVEGSPTYRQTLIAVGKGPEGMDLSPDGKQLWTAHSRDGSVSIIDVAAKKVTATLPVGTKRSNRIKFTPDGSHVFISDLDGGEVIVLDRATRKEAARLKVGRAPEGILMAPDGSRVYVAVSGDNEIAVIDAKSLQVIDHIAPGRGPDGMAWTK